MKREIKVDGIFQNSWHLTFHILYERCNVDNGLFFYFKLLEQDYITHLRCFKNV